MYTLNIRFSALISLPEDQSAELATLVNRRGQAPVAHTFNSNTRRWKLKVIRLGRQRNIRQGEKGAQDSI